MRVPIAAIRRGVLFAMVMSGLLGWATPLAQTAEPQRGLGGSTTFPAGTVFAIAPGETQPPVQAITLQNTGDGVAEVRLQSKSPDGVRILPERDQLRLPPKEQQTVPFAIEVGPEVAGGTYDVYLEGKQTNVPKPSGGVAFTPAFGVQFKVSVTGDGASVVVRAVDATTGNPVAGTLSIGMAVRQGAPIIVRQERGTELRTRLAPGNYLASYAIPGLTTLEQPFRVVADQNQEIVLKVTSIAFNLVAAKEKTDGRSLQSVDLLASVVNHLKPVQGPVSVQVNVDLDGAPIETVLLQQLPVLPRGTSEFRQNWSPPGGWQPGTYSFRFQIVAPQFAIDAAETPTVTVPRSVWLWVLVALATLLVLGLLWWVLVIRRRRRRDEDEPPPSGRRPIPPPTVPSPSPQVPMPPPTGPPAYPPAGPPMPPPTGPRVR